MSLMKQTNRTLLYSQCHNTYYYSLTPDFTNSNDIYCPLNVDTEFYHRAFSHVEYHDNPSPTITVQVRGVKSRDTAVIYSHPDYKEKARHPIMNVDFIGFQILKDNGCDIKYQRSGKGHFLNRDYLKTLPKFHFHLYAHFMVADFARLFTNDYRNDVLHLVKFPEKGTGKGITQERRMRTYTNSRYNFYEYCAMDWVITLNDVNYQVTIGIRDTGGLAGAISYADLAKIADVKLKYKDTLTQDDKENMDITYDTKPKIFDSYAKGDTYTHDCVIGFDKLYQELQAELGIPPEKRQSVRLTIGSSMARLIQNLLGQNTGLSDEEFENLAAAANPNVLRKMKTVRAVLSKVDGGRCYNNRPTDVVVDKKNYDNFTDFIGELTVLCDIDINGAYGEGLSLQDYPIGIPKSFNESLTGSNGYWTLRKFLKEHGDELEDGLWIMRVSNLKPLKYPQDFIVSWIWDFKHIDDLATDDDDDGIGKPHKGWTKIFSNSIKLGIITSDILDLIDNVCSRDQRNELLDNLLVINAMWYDKTQEVESVNEVIESVEEIKRKKSDKSEYCGDTLNTKETKSNKWVRINIGKLLINELLKIRKKYPKGTKENTFYKLCINTCYGVLISKWFNISNVVVGNNITARCRMMAWYLEKGLNFIQTITDGGTFELDKVVFPVSGRRLTANNLVSGYSKTVKERQWCLGKLKINKYWIGEKDGIPYCVKYGDEEDDFKKLMSEEYSKNTVIENDNLIIQKPYFEKVINDFDKMGSLTNTRYSIENDILEHLRNLFPNVKILHKTIINAFGIEQKGYYTLSIKSINEKGVFHGNANYKLSNQKEIKDDKLVFIYNKNNEIQHDLYRMRGYRDNSCFLLFEDDIESHEFQVEELEVENIFLFTENYSKTSINVPKTFLDNLEKNPDDVERMQPFIQNTIIKCKDYKQKYRSDFKNNNMFIGCTLSYSRLLTELSLGQFLFKNEDQYHLWLTKHLKTKGKYGQGYESLFTRNKTLKYESLLNSVNESILKGEIKRLEGVKHPYFELKDEGKESLINSRNYEMEKPVINFLNNSNIGNEEE